MFFLVLCTAQTLNNDEIREEDGGKNFISKVVEKE